MTGQDRPLLTGWAERDDEPADATLMRFAERAGDAFLLADTIAPLTDKQVWLIRHASPELLVAARRRRFTP